jgi:hypothetical protein
MQLNADNLETFLKPTDPSIPKTKALLFSRQDTVPITWQAIAKSLHTSISFGIAFQSDVELLAKFKVSELPPVIVIPDDNDVDQLPNIHVIPYQGIMEYRSLRTWLKDQVKRLYPEKEMEKDEL